MAKVWRCLFCKTENDTTNQFRTVGANVCEGCQKSRYLLPILVATGLVVLVGAVSGIVFAMTYPKRAYTAEFRKYFADRQISPEEREQLDKLMRRFKLSSEQRDEWERSEIADLGGTVAEQSAPALSPQPPGPDSAGPASDAQAAGAQDASIFIKQGMIYASQKNFTAAAKEFEAATKANTSSAEAWANLGSARQQLRDYSGALEAYTRALAIKQDYWQAHYNLGTLYVRLNDRDKALEELTKALETVSGDDRTTRADLVQAMQTDADLAALRGDRRFKELVAGTV